MTSPPFERAILDSSEQQTLPDGYHTRLRLAYLSPRPYLLSFVIRAITVSPRTPPRASTPVRRKQGYSLTREEGGGVVDLHFPGFELCRCGRGFGSSICGRSDWRNCWKITPAAQSKINGRFHPRHCVVNSPPDEFSRNLN